jgi:hypothetical protein
MKLKIKPETKWTVFFIFLTLVVIGFYFYLTNISGVGRDNDETEVVTKTQTIIQRNLDNRYPPTPKELVSFFAEITQCLYNETYTDKEFEGLGKQLYKLYDADFQQYNPWDTYFDDLKSDIANQKKSDRSIMSYTVSSSTDVNYYSQDGYDYAGLLCSFSYREGLTVNSTDRQFLLRKNENGHWKILGWKLVDE